MGYELGVDLGATTVAAAVTADSRAQMVDLGAAAATVPAVVFLDDDGSLIAGEAAARRAVEHPARAGRELTRKLGRPAPVRLGDTPYPPATLLGALLQHVVDRVAETAGGQPDRVLLTHPAHWSPARLAAFTEAARGAGLPQVRTATTAEAVVTHYATTGRIAEGDTVAVYDLGGDSFSAAVLRRTPTGVEPLGQPEGIERLGGGTFDEALLSHVNQATDGPLAGLDRRDPEHAAAVAGLRRSCVLAKQELSTEGATTIRVLLPNRQADVAVTRAEFEQLIRTSIETTIGALLKALQSAGVEPRELAAVLLVGGSSQIPLVARMVSEVLARPIMLDPDPKRPVTLGAATLAAAVPDTRAPARAARGRGGAGADRTGASCPPRRGAARTRGGHRPGAAGRRLEGAGRGAGSAGPSGGRGASGRGRHPRAVGGRRPGLAVRAVRAVRPDRRHVAAARRSRWRSPPRPRPRRSPRRLRRRTGRCRASWPATRRSSRRRTAPPRPASSPAAAAGRGRLHPGPLHAPGHRPHPAQRPTGAVLAAPAPGSARRPPPPAGAAGRAGPGRRAGRGRLRGLDAGPGRVPGGRPARRPHPEPSRPTGRRRPACPSRPSAPPCRSARRPASSSSRRTAGTPWWPTRRPAWSRWSTPRPTR